MAEVLKYVLDASVGPKWSLNDEQFTQQALAIRQDFVEDRIQLVAPEQIRYEVAAALLKATKPTNNPPRPPRIQVPLARIALERFLEQGIQYVSNDALTVSAFDIARTYGTSYYDALYLTLAIETNTPLIYADNNLRKNIGNRLPLALWIEDYPVSSH